MKHTKLRLRKERAIPTIIVIILGVLSIIIFSKVRAIVVALMIIAFCIIEFIKEWKAILLVTALVISFNLFDNSVINTVALGFFFNIVFINLSFNPKRNKAKYDIKKFIEKEHLQTKVEFNEAFFERVKDREKAIYTMIFYAISILPSVTLNVLLNKKDFLFEKIPATYQLYRGVLSFFNLNTNSSHLQKCTSISVVLIVIYMVLMLVIIISVNESRSTLNEIREKGKRNDSYWNGINLDIDENYRIYIDVVNNSSAE